MPTLNWKNHQIASKPIFAKTSNDSAKQTVDVVRNSTVVNVLQKRKPNHYNRFPLRFVWLFFFLIRSIALFSEADQVSNQVAYDFLHHLIFFGSEKYDFDTNITSPTFCCVGANQKEIWSFEIGEPVTAIACDPKNKKTFFGHSKCLYCVDYGGREIWNCEIGATITAICYNSENGDLFCIAKNDVEKEDALHFIASSGKKIGSWSCNDRLHQVAVDPISNRVFCSATCVEESCGYLYCLDSYRCKLWKYKSSAAIRSISYHPESQTIFCGSIDQKLHRVDFCGNRIWVQKVEQHDWDEDETPLKIVFDDTNKRIFFFSQQTLHCTNFEGEKIWNYPLEVVALEYDFESDQLLYGEAESLESVYMLYHAVKDPLKENFSVLYKHATCFYSKTCIACDWKKERLFFYANSHLHCVNFLGKQLWKVKLPCYLDRVMYDEARDRVICRSPMFALYSFDADGKLQWRFDIDSSNSCFVIERKNGDIFCEGEDFLYRVDLFGRKIGEYQIQAESYIYDEKNKRFFYSPCFWPRNSITCVDLDGNIVWKRKTCRDINGMIHQPNSGRLFFFLL